MRVYSFPKNIVPISCFKDDRTLKRHPDYRAAKAGDIQAAIRIVLDLVTPEAIAAARLQYGEDVVYLPVMAQEMAGHNQIPNALAMHYAAKAGGVKGSGIFQMNKTFHAGADAMERLIARAEFAGDVVRGKRYVLVDDVSTMGCTLADLASYIQENGGIVAGTVLLTNASRTGRMNAIIRTINRLGGRHGQQPIKELFGIEPDALTCDESQYLIGFRTTDELRNRAASASAERRRRIAAKTLSWCRNTAPLASTPYSCPSTSGNIEDLSGALPEKEWLSIGAIVEEVERLLKPFATEVPVLIRDSATEIGGITKTEDGVTSATVFGGRLFLFRDGLSDRFAVGRALGHELFHFGLRRFLTEREYIAQMIYLYMSDEWVRNKANAWLITDEALHLSQTKSPDYMRARAVDEALAELAEILYTEPTGYQNNTILAKTKRVVSEWIARIAESFGFKEAATAWRGYAAQHGARDLIVSIFKKLREGEPPPTLNTNWHYSDPAFMISAQRMPCYQFRNNVEKPKYFFQPKGLNNVRMKHEDADVRLAVVKFGDLDEAQFEHALDDRDTRVREAADQRMKALQPSSTGMKLR